MPPTNRKPGEKPKDAQNELFKRSVAGALLGTVFIFGLNEGLGLLFSAIGSGATTTSFFEIKGIVYGLAIVLFLRFEPDGLVGRWRDLKHYWTHWPFRY